MGITRKILLLLAVTAALGWVIPAPALSAVTGKEVEYKGGGVTMVGFIAWDPEIKGKRPGVLVVHEFWGLNDYVRKRARMLAELGYTAMAVDMYGNGKKSTHPDDARKFAAETMADMDKMTARFTAAHDLLKREPTVDPTRIGAIGYCFGGGVVLTMARQGIDLKGVVSFHGSLASKRKAERGRVKAKILVLHGQDDAHVSKQQLAAFRQEMKQARANFRIVSYPGAKHAFTNPEADTAAKKFGMKVGYNREADRKSWEEMKQFLRSVFARPELEPAVSAEIYHAAVQQPSEILIRRGAFERAAQFAEPKEA